MRRRQVWARPSYVWSQIAIEFWSKSGVALGPDYQTTFVIAWQGIITSRALVHDEGCRLGGRVGRLGGEGRTEVSVWCVWGSRILGSGAGKETGGRE